MDDPDFKAMADAIGEACVPSYGDLLRDRALLRVRIRCVLRKWDEWPDERKRQWLEEAERKTERKEWMAKNLLLEISNMDEDEHSSTEGPE